MKIGKEFAWEMGHRLRFHDGKCKNLHGHSYKSVIEFEGNEDQNGFVIDFFIVDDMIKNIIEELDHSFLVSGQDQELIDVLSKLNSKIVLIDSEPTSENICKYFLLKIKKLNLPANIQKVKIKVCETIDVYAELEAAI